jgi:hypothetical protein
MTHAGQSDRANDPRQHARRLGVRSLAVACELCHHQAVVGAATWPDDVSVPAFGPRMVCASCGTVGADALPNWREQAERPGLHLGAMSVTTRKRRR